MREEKRERAVSTKSMGQSADFKEADAGFSSRKNSFQIHHDCFWKIELRGVSFRKCK
jgi:hypothetical protein